MSVRLRLAVGRVVLVDAELFAVECCEDGDQSDAPPQLAGGSGSIVEPYVDAPITLGFRP